MAEARARQAAEGVKINLLLDQEDIDTARSGRLVIDVTDEDALARPEWSDLERGRVIQVVVEVGP